MVVDGLARVHHVDLAAVDHVDLFGPPDLHHDGTPRRVVGFERRSGRRRQQTGHDADGYRHRRVGDTKQALLQRFRLGE